MVGRNPAIYISCCDVCTVSVDARNKSGHDDEQIALNLALDLLQRGTQITREGRLLMNFSVRKIDRPGDLETIAFIANDRWGALYQGVHLLNIQPEPAMFWVAGPDGYKVDDAKAISDFADKNGYPNAWRTRDPRRQF